MIVYVDLIFLFNLLIDALILQATAWTRKIRASLWRIAVAAAIGASYVVMMFVPVLSFAFTFMVKALVSMLVVYIAYGFSSVNFYVRNLAAFYLLNFCAAGGIVATSFFIHSTHDVFNGILFAQSGGFSYEMKIGGMIVIVLLPLSLLLYSRVASEKQRKSLLGDCLAQAMITVDAHELTCTGLIDTGNQLYDPLSRHPVIIMEVAQWSGLVPEQWIAAIQQQDDDQLLNAVSESQGQWQQRLRIIPFRGINRGAQFILAVKPDKVVVVHHNDVSETSDVWIGLSGNKLCMDGSYQAIIHPAITNTSRR